MRNSVFLRQANELAYKYNSTKDRDGEGAFMFAAINDPNGVIKAISMVFASNEMLLGVCLTFIEVIKEKAPDVHSGLVKMINSNDKRE